MVIKLKDTYKFCTLCGHELVRQKDFKKCPKCDTYYHFNARPSTAAILTNKKGEILLVKRSDEPFKGYWDLPGGFVDAGESLEEALKRELAEETGLKITELKYVGSAEESYEYRDTIIPVVTILFAAKVSGSADINLSDENDDYVFLAPDKIEIEHVAFYNQRELLRHYISS